MHKNKRVIRRTDGHSSSVRLPTLAPYPSTGHSSVGRVVRPYEPPALLTCLRLTRAFSLSTSRACHKVHVEDGTHRVDIRPTSGSLTLQVERRRIDEVKYPLGLVNEPGKHSTANCILAEYKFTMDELTNPSLVPEELHGEDIVAIGIVTTIHGLGDSQKKLSKVQDCGFCQL